jgi:hypothetical protein
MSFSSWLRNRTSNRAPRGRAQYRPAAFLFRPQLEVLEDRWLPSFLAPVPLPVSGHVAVGDFNGDKRLDIVTTQVGDMGSSRLYVLLQDRKGGFYDPGSGSGLGVGSFADSVAVGDFNGDNKLDVVVTNHDQQGSNGAVVVLLGKGDGTFSSNPQRYPVSGIPLSVATADLNGDKLPDIVTANSDGTVSVLLATGKGHFAAAQNYAVGGPPAALAVADLNRDGKNDLVTANWDGTVGTLSVLLNNGNGTFAAAQNFAGPAGVGAIATGDLNGDGKVDLVTMGDSLSVLLGNGDGTFGNPQSYQVPFSTSMGIDVLVAVADFNQDGKLDVVAAGAGKVSVLLGNGDGTLATALNYNGGLPLAVGDFNRDGYPDLVSGNAVLLNARDWNL